jgi:hypothetical protein
MSRHVLPGICLTLVSFAVAGISAAQQASGNAAAEAQAPQASTTATQPPATDTAKTASAPTAAAATTAAAAPAPAPAGPSAALIKEARSIGFKVKGTGEQTRFCKTEAQIGTNIVTQNCMNENQLQMYLERTEQDRNDMMRMQGGCSAPGCVHN